MATNVKRVKTFMLDLSDKPGDLATVIGACREAKVEMYACTAAATEGGKGKATFYPKETPAFEGVLKKLGRKYSTAQACWAEGDDKLGVYNDLLQKVAKAGVNLWATDATGTGGKFSSVFYTDAGQYDKLCKALGC